MKKMILLILALVVILSSFVSAEPDLIIKDFEFTEEPISGAELYYKVFIQNIGDNPVTTRLPISVWTSTDPSEVGTGWFSIIRTGWKVLQDGSIQTQAPIEKVIIQKEDGTIRYEKPEVRIISTDYALKGEELEKAVSEYEEQLRWEVENTQHEKWRLTESEIQERIQNYREGKSQDSIGREYSIILNPKETVIWNSEDSKPNVMVGGYGYSIRFFPQEHSLEGSKGFIDIKIDPNDEIIESNNKNNLLHKEIIVKGSVTQGPFDGSKNVPSLKENEYFVLGQGCADLRERKICFGDDNKGNLIFSVDGKEKIVDRYNKLYLWFIKLIMDGKESPSVEINGIELSIYIKGYKIKY